MRISICSNVHKYSTRYASKQNLYVKKCEQIRIRIHFQYASNVHKYNTRYASKQNLYVKKVHKTGATVATAGASAVTGDATTHDVRTCQ